MTALFAIACVVGFGVDAMTRGRLNMAAYVPCFLCGVLCYALRDTQRPVLSGRLWAPFIAATFALYCLVHLGRPEPVYWIGWLFCLALGLAINQFGDSTARVLNLPAQRMATYSYGVYLLHVPVLHLLFTVLGVRTPGVGVPL